MLQEHLWDLEPRADCDHKGFRKHQDESRNPDPVVFTETMICSNCDEITSVRVKYDKRLGRHP